MYTIEKDNFNEIYKEIVEHVISTGREVIVRDENTLECTNCCIVLTNIINHKLDFMSTQAFKRQEVYEEYCKNEIAWYESGSLEAASAPAKKWKEIADKDGKIQSNYGHIILFDKKPYTTSGSTTYEFALDLLKKDKFSRQVILHYNLPAHYDTGTKDIPCTVATQVLIRNDRVSFTVFQRSSDLHWGLIYDLPWHCYLMNKIVSDLKGTYSNIYPGRLHMIFGSIHIYQKDISAFNDFLTKRDA